MKLSKLAMAGLLIVLPAFTQEEKQQAKAEATPRIQKIFEIKHADVRALANILTIFQVPMQVDQGLKIIAVSGSRETVAAIEEAIKRFDVPPPAKKNIELTFYMLMTLPEASKSSKLPAELEGVAKQLKTIFGFQDVQLLETLAVRTRDGEGIDTSGAVPSPSTVDAAYPISYGLRIKAASISSAEKVYSIRIDQLKLGLQVPYEQAVAGHRQFQFRSAGLNTDLDVREGQKVVVGKANVTGSDYQFILVVTAKVVE